MQRSTTIAAVTAPSFIEFPESTYPRQLTPRLRLVLSCDCAKGRPRCYEMAVYYDRLSEDGHASTLVDFQAIPKAVLFVSNRFSQVKFDQLAAAILAGEFDQTVDQLYEMAVRQHSEHRWSWYMLQPRVIPADGFADGGEFYTDEEMEDVRETKFGPDR